MTDYADPEWPEEFLRRQGETARDATDAARELSQYPHLAPDLKRYALTPADQRFLTEVGIAYDASETDGSLYHGLPDRELEPLRRYGGLVARLAALASITMHVQNTQRAQPTARYAYTLLHEAYHDALANSVPTGAAGMVEACLDELAAQDPLAPVPAQAFHDLFLRACPEGQRYLTLFLRRRGAP